MRTPSGWTRARGAIIAFVAFCVLAGTALATSAPAAQAAPATITTQDVQPPMIVWPATPAVEALPAIASANTYTYTKILQCKFVGIANYTVSRLVIEHAGTWKHVYRLQFGTILGPNTEQIRWVYVRQAQPNGTWMGNGYSQAFVNVTGGATAAIGSGYTPWIPSTQSGNAFIQEQNVNNSVCGRWFPTDGSGSDAGGNW